MILNQQPDYTAVIVSYHSEPLLAECLSSLAALGSSGGLEVIVVDNSATLGKRGFTERFPWVRFLENPRNVGFARASNQGLRLAAGRHLLLLNPDTRVHPGAMQALVRYLDRHPHVGAVGPRLLNGDGTLQHSCRRFPGLLTAFFGRYSLLTRLFPANSISRDFLYLDWDHEDVRVVDWVTGACLMVRREVVEAVGLLDEGYFLFIEDTDWCRRIRDAGWDIAYVSNAVVTHQIGVSRGPASPRVVWARHASMFRYLRKHLTRSFPLLTIAGAGLLVRAALLILSSGVRLSLGALASVGAGVPIESRAEKPAAEG
jgi:GT2 family glycosyltransferase